MLFFFPPLANEQSSGYGVPILTSNARYFGHSPHDESHGVIASLFSFLAFLPVPSLSSNIRTPSPPPPLFLTDSLPVVVRGGLRRPQSTAFSCLAQCKAKGGERACELHE